MWKSQQWWYPSWNNAWTLPNRNNLMTSLRHHQGLFSSDLAKLLQSHAFTQAVCKLYVWNWWSVPLTRHGSASAGTSARWAPGWSVTTFPAWWTSSVSCASGTRTWCSPSAREPKSGSESASTSLDTTAGTAARWTGTTPCLAGWCWEVSLRVCVCDWDFCLCGSSYVRDSGCLCQRHSS